jgi:large repetitive protein
MKKSFPLQFLFFFCASLINTFSHAQVSPNSKPAGPSKPQINNAVHADPAFQPFNGAASVAWIDQTDFSKSHAFVPNYGQFSDIPGLEKKEILFGMEGNGTEIYFTHTGLIYRISDRVRVSEREFEEYRESHFVAEAQEERMEREHAFYITKTVLVEMNFEGCDPNAQLVSEDQTGFYFNYFRPLIDRENVIGQVYGFKKITYKNLYPGIDVEYTIHPEGGIKYACVLNVGANPAAIKMTYSGAKIRSDKNGNISIATELGNITDHSPETFSGGSKIASSFSVKENTVGFLVGTENKIITALTVIDPWTVGPPIQAGRAPCDIATDGSSNVLVYAMNPANSTAVISKYDAAGTFLWTFNLTGSANYSSAFQGDVQADVTGNVYVCIGLGPTTATYYNTIKINPAGTALVWGSAGGNVSSNLMYETWTLAFKCDYTQLVQSGGGIMVPPLGPPYYNVGVYESVNITTGAEGTLTENDTLGEIISTAFAPNGLLYHLSADSNIGATRTGLAAGGAKNRLTCINPVTNTLVWKRNTGYNYVDGDEKAPGSVGINAIAASCNFLYTTDGLKLSKWGLANGAYFGQIFIPGGSNVPNSGGGVNSGIVVDRCGNVYVGANGNIYVYDENLALLNTISGLPSRIYDMAWGPNGQLYVCGGPTAGTSFIASVTIPTCNLPNSGLTVTAVQPTCSTPGSATATPTFCGAPYTYSWSNGGTTQTVNNLAPGTYTVTVTGAQQCPFTYTATTTVTINPAPSSMTVAASQTNVTCNALCNGSATATPSGGTSPYTYSWAPSGGNAVTASNLCAGTYTCTITDASGCTTTQSFTITQPVALTATQSQVNILCNAACNGSASVVASGGTGPYTYSWAPNGGNAATATGLCAGTYTCTITDANNCVTTKSFTITQPPALTSAASQTNLSCNAVCNGTASVVAGGGTGPYTYNWTPAPGAGQGTPNATTLCAGLYTCTITDANNCTTTSTFNITQPTALLTTQNQVNLTCNAVCNGSATVNPSGGSGPYTFAWAPSGGNAATASGLCAGGYTCTITDANNCVITAPFNITQPPALTASSVTTNANCGGNNGTATATAGGGTGPYLYAWTPAGGNAATATGLTAGSYTCTITDANGCTITTVANVNTTNGPTATISSSTNNSCFGGNNGSATANPTGGTGPYTYSWSPSGGNAQTATGLPAGIYTCTITDASGCVTSVTVNITQPPQLTATSTSTPANCGGNNGTATATPAGGTGPYTYAWSSGGNSATETTLVSGSYTCTVTDANGCTTTTTATVTNTGGPTASITAFSDISCFGGTNGSATANATAGNGPFTYGWSSGGSSATEINLAAGTYTCTVTDAGGCITTVTVTLTEPAQLTTSVSSTPSACGGNNGTATVNPSGGIPGYIYNWSSGGSASTENNLASGNYTCLVTDANGCTTTASVTVINSNGPTATLSASSDVSCFGGNNGSATVNGSGGNAPYTYSWSPSGGTNATATNLSAGTYTCTLTDSTGCIGTASVTITEPIALSLAATGLDASCNGVCDGQVVVIPNGGTQPYAFLWNTGCTNPSCNALCAGSYTVLVTDNNGCFDTVSAVVNEPAAITTAMSSTPSTCGNPNGSATVAAAGGNGTYTYSWSPSGGTNATANNLSATLYTVTVTDNNGCFVSDTITVSSSAGVNVTLNASSNITCFGACDGSAAVNASGGTGSLTYNWLPSGGNAASATNLCSGTFTCTVTDSLGCTGTFTVAVTEPAQLTLTPGAPQSICTGQNATVSVIANGGTSPYTYSWSPGNLSGFSQTVSPAATTVYTVVVTDNNGCSAVDSVTVTVNASPNVTFTGDTLQGCSPLCVNFSDQTTIAASSTIIAWSWDFGDAGTSTSQNPQHCYTLSGTYSVTLTVTGTGGCTSSVTYSNYIDVAGNPTAAFTASPQPVTIANPTVNFTDESTGATSWSWNFGDVNGSSSSVQNPTFIYPDTGCYMATLYVANAAGCVDSASENVCIDPDWAIYIPNAFTPDGDNNNEIFIPKGMGLDPEHFEMWIFDRWGNLIYHTTDFSKGWDGHANGGSEPAQIDVYVYRIECKDITGLRHEFIGRVSLIR